MLRIPSLLSWYTALIVPTLGFQGPAICAQNDASVIKIIKSLSNADDFDSTDAKQIKDLPVTSIPLLTENLRKVPPAKNHNRHFGLLALKVAQFERKLSRPILDDAVAALLERLRPEDHATISLKGRLRNKLKEVAFIEDPRMVEGVRKARVYLGLEPDTADPAYRPSMPGAAAAKVSPMMEKPTSSAQIATTSAVTSNSPQTPSALWPALIVMALAVAGLLWMLLKPKAAAYHRSDSR